MGNNDKPKSFRERFINRKTILIGLAIVIIVGFGTGFGLVKASDNPAFCTTCHIMKPYYESWKNSNLLANKHSAAGITCHQCHESSIAIQASEGLKFVTGNYEKPLKKRDLGTTDFCLKCHSESGTLTPKGTTFEEAKAKTKFDESNPHESHNGELDCNTCHNMHQKSTVMCTQCHSFDWMNDLDDSWQKK